MLESIPRDLERSLMTELALAGVELNEITILSEGEAPHKLWYAIPLISLSLPLLLLLQMVLTRNVVFGREGTQLSYKAIAAPSDSSFRQSAHLSLAGKLYHYCYDAPSTMREKNGEVYLVPRGDASRPWMTGFSSGQLDSIEAGYLYLGFGRRPALKLAYTDTKGETHGSTILSFDNVGDRQQMFNRLSRLKS